MYMKKVKGEGRGVGATRITYLGHRCIASSGPREGDRTKGKVLVGGNFENGWRLFRRTWKAKIIFFLVC